MRSSRSEALTAVKVSTRLYAVRNDVRAPARARNIVRDADDADDDDDDGGGHCVGDGVGDDVHRQFAAAFQPNNNKNTLH